MSGVAYVEPLAWGILCGIGDRRVNSTWYAQAQHKAWRRRILCAFLGIRAAILRFTSGAQLMLPSA